MSEMITNVEKVSNFKKRAEELVSQMTLEEKVLQMLHSAPAIERLSVKAYNWWNEGLHGVARAGVATIFPQAIGLAAMFDEDMMEIIGDAIATEARAKFNMQQESDDTDIYKGLTFWAPNINIFRDPRWGRGHETYGEDPYLTSRLGVRFVEGLQGHDENYMKVAACAKHFAVHSGPEELRHEFNAVVSKKDLYETYLPAFEALVKEAKVETVMGAYNRTNDEPCCGSKMLLKDILRDDWKFDGHVVSDCWAIKDFHENHKVTNSAVESVALAVKNGCDINCGNIFIYLQEAVKQGLITEEQIDTAVTRLFTTRMKLGLFDDKDKVPFNKISYKEVDSKKMRQLNLEVAEKSIVLLKNKDNILPLNKEKISTIGVIGPNANSRRALVGNYEGTASRYVTVLEGLQDYLNDDIRVMYSEGCHLYKSKVGALCVDNDLESEVRGVCKESDVVVAVMGLDSGLEGEEGDEGNAYASGDKPNLKLPGLQEHILKVCKESGKPLIVVVLSGSALDLRWAHENADAVIQGWYPGAQGGMAIAKSIFGDNNFEAKLPLTFYKTSEELPEFTDYSMEGRTYRYMKNEPLYPFGYGLSYTDFEISNVNFDTDKITDNGVNINLTIKNKGNFDGAETVQVYVKANMDNTPNAQLKALKKVSLKKGENKDITLSLPIDSFKLCNDEGIKVLNNCDYTVYVGTCQPDKRSLELTNTKCVEKTLVLG